MTKFGAVGAGLAPERPCRMGGVVGTALHPTTGYDSHDEVRCRRGGPCTRPPPHPVSPAAQNGSTIEDRASSRVCVAVSTMRRIRERREGASPSPTARGTRSRGCGCNVGGLRSRRCGASERGGRGQAPPLRHERHDSGHEKGKKTPRRGGAIESRQECGLYRALRSMDPFFWTSPESALILICLGLASSRLGSSMWSRPLEKVALIFSRSTLLGSVKERTN